MGNDVCPLTFGFVKVAKDLRVGFVQQVDLLQQSHQQCLTLGAFGAVQLLVILVLVFKIVFGTRLVRPRAVIIRCVHHVTRCVVNQQLVETESGM